MSSTSSSTLLRITCVLWLLSSALSATTAARASKDSNSLPLPMQLRIWQCRQRCYHQTLLKTTPPALCHSRPDCYMCHDYCRVLVVAQWSLAAAMCADRVFCSRGCRTACQFHRHYTAV
ncbi:hypothetical protein ACLKA7_006451 [Drosophila subpalustris]